MLDELQIYRRELTEGEVGPVASPVWQTVWRGGTTNLVLAGSGPPGRTLTYALVPGMGPTNGRIVSAPGSAAVVYRAGNRKGPDRFAYTVSDGEFTSAPAVVSRVLSPVAPWVVGPTRLNAPALWRWAG